MIYFLIKSQQSLFDTPVHVAASVRRDGTVVKPHIRIMKVALKPAVQHSLFAEPTPAAPVKRTKLDAFVAKHGGLRSLASVLSGMTAGQQQTLFAAMGKLDGKEPVEVAAMFDGLAEKAPERGETVDLFAAPVAEPEPNISAVEPKNDIARQHRILSAKLSDAIKTHDIHLQLKLIEEKDNLVDSLIALGWTQSQIGANALGVSEDHFNGLVKEGIYSRQYGATDEKFRKKTSKRKSAPAPTEPDHTEHSLEMVEHVTGKGKTLRGVVRTDVTAEQAKAIDPYTFKKDGGWFIREKHLGEAKAGSGKLLTEGEVRARAKQAVDARAAVVTPVTITSPVISITDTAPKNAYPDAKTHKNSADPEKTHTEPFGVPAGISKPRRREINAAAAALIHSGADLTEANRATLRQYSGNGGCGDSLNEFYTDPDVAAAMWTVLGKLGVSHGTVLEPSCATGVFMHTAPSGVRLTGVEMDPTSAAIAAALHGDRHEIIPSSLERFATTDGPRQFDSVIGNAPFGIRGSLIKDDKSDLKTAEGYFLDTSLDKTRPGGVVAMIVPTGVMDSRSARAVRQRLLCKGEFLGAVRMPNTAFEHSHTEVTTDIVYFRKRPDDVAGALLALDKTKLKSLGVWDDEYLSGGYFEGRGAGSIFGTMEAGWRAKAGIGDDITVSGSMIGVPESVAAWTPDEFKTATPSVPEIMAAAGTDDALRKRVLAGALKRPYEAGKAGDTKIEDGVQYILQGKPLRWHRVDEFTQSPEVTGAQQLARDIESAINGGPRDGLAARVQDYIDTFGNPAKNKNLLLAATQDRVLYRLIGAVGADGTLSDVVADRAARKVEGSLDLAAHSLALEHESGLFSVAELADRMGKSAEDLEDTLFASSAYAYAGDGRWTPMERYLTGELWPKLDALREAIKHGELREGMAEKYALQVSRLEAVIDPKSLEDVDIAINSAFLPVSVLESFFNESNANSENEWVRKKEQVSITFADSWYTVEGGKYDGDIKLLSDYLNRDGVRKDDMHKIEAWNESFKEWLLSSQYRDQVEDMYNRKFRGFVQAEYSDAAIVIPGMNTDGLKQYQYSGLRWALAAGKGIIAADVGLGKTVRGLMLARMAKINGTAKRPTFVVPKSVLANWVAEAEKWFPGSRVLVVGETYTRDKDGTLKSKSDTAEQRNRKLHDMTQNDYDFVFISQPAFNDIDIDPIIKGQYVNSDFWVQRGDKKGNEGDKRLKKVREAYDQAIANREFQKRSDAIYWDDLGIDMLLADEGHCFPAGTLIDGRPIESYRAGDMVQAFDHISGCVVKSRVMNLQVRRPASLFRVSMSDGTSITCTGKHPFFTQRGYVFAEELKSGDIAYKNLYNSGNEDNRLGLEEGCSPVSNGGMELQSLQSADAPEQGSGLASSRARKVIFLLQQVVRNVVEACSNYFAKRDSRGEFPSIRSIQAGIKKSGTLAQSDVRRCNPSQGKRNLEREDVQACHSWRKWARTNCSTIAVGECAWMGDGISDQVPAARERSVLDLQVGYRESGVQDINRGGWSEPSDAQAEANRQPQGESLVAVRVDHIEVFQREGDGTFGRLCPGGVVYNIEVEKHHNYFAHGILVHNSYKNLFAAKNRFGESPKFLGGQGQSNRAFDMNMKTRYLREHNGGNGVFMLTATPTKNSPLEIYSMLSHIAPEAFERIGIRNSEEFLDRFCTFVEDKVLSTSGAIEDALVTAGFKNLGELREIMRRYIDRKTAADVGLVMPTRDDQMHLIDMSERQEEVYAGLRQDLIDSAKEKDATGDSHVFSIMDKMGKAAMDLELLDDQYTGERSPKYDEAAKHIVAGTKEGGQVVFAESVKSHQKLLEALVAAGIPRNQIAIINAKEAESSAKRQNIADGFNSGKLKVVIGNTATMGEGINLQKATTDIHHLDLPWDPASMQQRNGRGLRQGNVNASVRIHTYMAKGSFDGYRYQSMMAKKDWQDMLWNGGDTVDNLSRAGKFDRADLMIMMSADPEAERAKFEADKAAATQRYDTDQRREVAVEFKRVQLMKQSYGALKNKQSGSAERLRQKLESAKTKLAGNKYFTAKGALDAKVPVVIHPDTGLALMAGVGLDVTEADGTAGKWVVTGVAPVTGDVSMRRYGELGKGALAITVPTSKLAGGVKPFDYKEADEHAAVAAKLAEHAESKLGEVADLKSLRDMPSGVINANYRMLQDRLKEGFKAYKWTAPHGGMGFIDAEGTAVIGESWETSKLAAAHDLMLPTQEHREKAIAAYVADEQAKRFTHDSVTARRNSTPQQRFVQKMPGKHDQRTNRWGGVGKELFGEGFQRDAHAEFTRVQGEAVRHAKTFGEALKQATPMVEVGYDSMPKWSRRTLALLFAKAKHDGVLNESFDAVQPKQVTFGREHNLLPKDLWKTGYDGHSASAGRYENGTATSASVRDTLINLAKGNSHPDLATAMMVSTADKDNYRSVARELLNLHLSQNGVVDGLMHLVDKYPELGTWSLKDLGMSTYRQNSHINNNDLGRTLSEMLPKFLPTLKEAA